MTGAATLGSTLAVTGKSDLPTVSTASANAAVAVITDLSAAGASITSANVGTAVVTTGTVTNLTATSASVASVNAGVALLTTATVTNLTATGASIASANLGNAVISALTLTGVSVASANVGVANITDLRAVGASVTSANLGTAVVTNGTVTNLTATSASVASVNAAVALVTTGTVTNLTSTAASIASANVGTAVITTLTATGASIASANAGNVQATIASVGSANLGTAVITTGTLTNLTATSASVASVNAGVALVTTGTVTNLTSTAASIASANIGVAAIGTLSFTGASIASLNAGVANITDLRVAGASVTSANLGTAVITTGNLNFSSTAQRITGDFSNATVANRVMFQSSTTNGASQVSVIPNGTGTNAGFLGYGSSDPSNASFWRVSTVTGTEVRFESGLTGTGTYLPMTFYTGGSERVRIDTSGNMGIGLSSLTIPLQIGKGGGGNPATSGTTQTYGIARIGSSGAAALDVGTYAAGQVWMQGVNVTNLATNYDLVLQPNGGNVGIGGTTRADTKLDIKGTLPSASGGYSYGVMSEGTIPSASTLEGNGFLSFPSTQAASFTLTNLIHYNTLQGTFGAGSTVTNQYGFHAASSLTGATNNYGFYSNIAAASNRWNFYAAGTAQNYFAGNTGIGTTSPSYKLQVNSGTASATADAITVQNASVGSLGDVAGIRFRFVGAEPAAIRAILTNQSTGEGALGFYTSSDGAGANITERMRITSGGEVYVAGTTDQGAYNLQCNGTGVWGAGAYVNGSDARLKDDITTLNDGLNVVSQLRPVTFKYKPDYSKDQNVQTGFIAQELQAVLAGKDYVDGVVQAGPNHLNVAYQSLIPILVKAIQELTARVAELEAK